MKNKIIYQTLASIFILSMSIQLGFSQCSIHGTVIERDKNSAVEFATVSLEQDGKFINGTVTNEDGKYCFHNINPGTYEIIVSFIGLGSQRTTGVLVKEDQLTNLDIYMSASDMNGHSIQIVAYRVPDAPGCVHMVSPAKIIEKKPTNLQGKVMEEATGIALPFATVLVFQNGKLITGTDTDFDGHYNIYDLMPGIYELEVSFIGYKSVKQSGITVAENKLNNYDFSMVEGDILVCGGCSHRHTPPLIDFHNTSSGTIMLSDDIRRKQF